MLFPFQSVHIPLSPWFCLLSSDLTELLFILSEFTIIWEKAGLKPFGY